MERPTEVEIWINGLIGYWVGKLLPDVTVIVGESRAIDSHMWCDEIIPDKLYKLMYHPENILEWNLHMIIGGVFHEIGHIKMGWVGKGNGGVQDIIDEAVAERYAMDRLHEFYPESIQSIVRFTKREMKSPKWRGKWPTHFLAYSQIEEYQ